MSADCQHPDPQSDVVKRLENLEAELKSLREQYLQQQSAKYSEDKGILPNDIRGNGAKFEMEIDMEEAEVDKPELSKMSPIMRIQDGCTSAWRRNRRHLVFALKLFMLLLYGAYFTYAMYYSFGDEGSIRLLAGTCLVIVACLYSVLRDNCGSKLYKTRVRPRLREWKKNRACMIAIKCIFALLCIALVLAFLTKEIAMKDPKNLTSLSGMAILLLLVFFTSTNPARVRWRPVVSGMALQLIFAVVMLRTQWGFRMFEWAGERVQEFLKHSDKGAEFVFGPSYTLHMIAFQVLPILVFFSSFIFVLYYLGWMQVIIQKIAWILQKALGTTAAESVNASANIFMGFAESPLVILPLLEHVTSSELHAIMTSGFATIAGSVMAAYMLFGVPAAHLLTACIISAPAALAVAKLSYPETEKTKLKFKDIQKMGESEYKGFVEAMSAGAMASIKLCANIAVNLIAFVAFLDFVNGALYWFGERVGIRPPDYQPLSFQFIMSYLLWPIAFVMGIDSADCRQAAELLGIKAFLTEFVAYLQLGEMIRNREYIEKVKYNGTIIQQPGGLFLPEANKTLKYGFMTERSEVITTYALCGFSSVQGIGIMLGVMTAIMPQRKTEITKIILRAFMSGSVACYLTACVAGLLFEPSAL